MPYITFSKGAAGEVRAAAAARLISRASKRSLIARRGARPIAKVIEDSLQLGFDKIVVIWRPRGGDAVPADLIAVMNTKGEFAHAGPYLISAPGGGLSVTMDGANVAEKEFIGRIE